MEEILKKLVELLKKGMEPIKQKIAEEAADPVGHACDGLLPGGRVKLLFPDSQDITSDLWAAWADSVHKGDDPGLFGLGARNYSYLFGFPQNPEGSLSGKQPISITANGDHQWHVLYGTLPHVELQKAEISLDDAKKITQIAASNDTLFLQFESGKVAALTASTGMAGNPEHAPKLAITDASGTETTIPLDRKCWESAVRKIVETAGLDKKIASELILPALPVYGKDQGKSISLDEVVPSTAAQFPSGVAARNL